MKHMNRRFFLGATSSLSLASPSWARKDKQVDYSQTGATIVEGAGGTDGYHFPAEWEKHERTLMQFPSPQNWRRRDLEDARREWAETANTVADFEPVTMAVRKQDLRAAKSMLSSQIELVEMPLNDAWSRDSGPMILKNASGDRRVAGFTFNGWGKKFPPYRDDQLVKGRLAAKLDMPMYQSNLVLEGGAVAFDGQGTVLTTEECLLNRNRNPSWTKAEIEDELRAHLGVTKVLWLPQGLTPDPITDGHIDGIAAFAAPGMVLLHTTNDPSDPNMQITKEARAILESATDAAGRKLDVVEIPLTSFDVVHMNFYICNGAIIVPASGVRTEDDEPLAILREVFPHHEVIGVSGRMIGGGGGGVHCITQQVPAI